MGCFITNIVLAGIKNMSNEGGNQGIETDGAFTMQAMHQQFERLNIMFNEIRDRMDTQDATIAIIIGIFSKCSKV